MEHLLIVSGANAMAATTTNLQENGLYERRHLQEWIIAHPGILGGDVLVVTSEYDQWAADTDGAPARERLDILGLDETGRLVVVELKRGAADRDVHLQAITYAALVSRFTLDTLAQAHQRFLETRLKQPVDIEQCRSALLEHSGGDLDSELLRRPRQVLVAASFPKQVTHTVVWLSEMNLDIDLVEFSMWRVGDQVVAAFTKVYPTPEAEEFTLGPARAEAGAVSARVQDRVRAKNAAQLIVEAGLLPDGARLRMTPSHGTTPAIRDDINSWIAEDPTRGVATWQNTKTKPLVWLYDHESYSTTGLANKVFETVTGRMPDGIQGTRWWVIDSAHVPDGVDRAEWEVLDGRNLVDLAKGLRAGPRNWNDLHTLLRGLPSGQWTTYGDIAEVIGSGPIAVGRHLGTCAECTNQWRVMNSKGQVPQGFRWPPGSGMTDRPEEILTHEGVAFVDGMADSRRRLSHEDLNNLLDG